MSADDLYKIGTLAKQLGVTTPGLRKWANTYADHLSESARPRSGSERQFTEQDADTLRQIAAMRSAGFSHDEILAKLRTTAQEPPGAPKIAEPYRMTSTPANVAPGPSVIDVSSVERLLPLLRAADRPVEQVGATVRQMAIAFAAGAAVVVVAVLLAVLILWAII